jgi:hypothetical protein
MLHITLRKDLDKWAVDRIDQRLEDTPFEEYKHYDINSASYIPDEAQTFCRGDKVAFLSLFHNDENLQCHLVLRSTGEPGVYSRIGVGCLQFRPRFYKVMSYNLAHQHSDDADGTNEGEEDENRRGKAAGIEGIEGKVEEKEQPRPGQVRRDNRAMKGFLNLWETRTIELI